MGIANFRHSVHAGIGMQHDRIRGIPMSRQKLLPMRRPLDRCDLGRCSQAVKTSAGGAVPYVDRGIVGTTAGRQKRVLPRAPSNSLYNRSMKEPNYKEKIDTLTAAV